MINDNIKDTCVLIKESDGILIGAGAGLTAAAGLNYSDREAFARVFPAWKRRGFLRQYDLVGYRNWTPLEMWGYWATQLNYVYYSQSTNPLYQKLRSLIGDRNCFVMTSNVDELFHKNGFDTQRIYSPQGSYGKIQCTIPCCQQAWDMKPFFDRLNNALDPVEQIIVDEAAVPVCPNCGGSMFPNVRVDGSMVDGHFAPERERLLRWLDDLNGKKLLLLDLGSGYNTPAVIRLPMERITASFANSALIRVNMEHADVPRQIAHKSICIKGDISEFIEQTSKKET